MAVKVEKVEKNKVALEISVEAEEFNAAINRTAKKLAGQVNIPGFRRGKAPRHLVEQHLGKEYVLNEALEPVLGPAYVQAIQETEIEPVSRPEVELVQAEGGRDLIFKAIVEVKPEVELGEYTGLGVEKQEASVTEEEVDKELERRQEMHATVQVVEEGKVENKDIVTIDFEGFKDGVPFEGGKAEDHELTIGSGQFIPGFEEQLIGSEIGQELDVNVKFPDEYHSKELAGQDALFKVKIKETKRKELVPLDDEFAKDVSEFETLDELRQDIKQKMITSTEMRLNNEHRAEVVKKAVDNANVEVPEGMIEMRIDSMLNDLQTNLSYQGLTLEQYCDYINSSSEKLREDYRSQAVEAIKTELVLEEIGKKLDITISDEDMDAEMEKLSEHYGRKVEELKAALEARGELSLFKQGMISDKVVDYLVENNHDQNTQEPAETDS